MLSRTHKIAWSYAAGIIDGEGCIKIQRFELADRNFPCYQLVVQVDMVSKIIVTWMHERFGGKLYLHHRKLKNCNDSWRWYLMDKKSVRQFLLGIHPYILLKTLHIQNALHYLQISHRDQRKYGTIEKEKIWKQSCKLNKRGTL